MAKKCSVPVRWNSGSSVPRPGVVAQAQEHRGNNRANVRRVAQVQAELILHPVVGGPREGQRMPPTARPEQPAIGQPTHGQLRADPVPPQEIRAVELAGIARRRGVGGQRDRVPGGRPRGARGGHRAIRRQQSLGFPNGGVRRVRAIQVPGGKCRLTSRPAPGTARARPRRADRPRARKRGARRPRCPARGRRGGPAARRVPARARRRAEGRRGTNAAPRNRPRPAARTATAPASPKMPPQIRRTPRPRSTRDGRRPRRGRSAARLPPARCRPWPPGPPPPAAGGAAAVWGAASASARRTWQQLQHVSGPMATRKLDPLSRGRMNTPGAGHGKAGPTATKAPPARRRRRGRSGRAVPQCR